jgi:hypothetical protein
VDTDQRSNRCETTAHHEDTKKNEGSTETAAQITQTHFLVNSTRRRTLVVQLSKKLSRTTLMIPCNLRFSPCLRGEQLLPSRQRDSLRTTGHSPASSRSSPSAVAGGAGAVGSGLSGYRSAFKPPRDNCSPRRHEETRRLHGECGGDHACDFWSTTHQLSSAASTLNSAGVQLKTNPRFRSYASDSV